MELVSGLHAVLSMLKSSPQRIVKLSSLKGRDDPRLKKIIQLAQKENIEIEWLPRKTLDTLSEANHQGIIATVKPGQTHDETFLFRLMEQDNRTPFILILDGVTDPHNLGACLRTADAAGVMAGVVPKDKSVGLTETVRKVACGAAESVPVIPVTNLARCMGKLQELGLWFVGTAGDAETSIFDMNLVGPLALVMGSEGSGMRRLTREHCDYLAYIPMDGSVSSLNVSVATGVCLFEAVRQRQAQK